MSWREKIDTGLPRPPLPMTLEAVEELIRMLPRDRVVPELTRPLGEAMASRLGGGYDPVGEVVIDVDGERISPAAWLAELTRGAQAGHLNGKAQFMLRWRLDRYEPTDPPVEESLATWAADAPLRRDLASSLQVDGKVTTDLERLTVEWLCERDAALHRDWDERTARAGMADDLVPDLERTGVDGFYIRAVSVKLDSWLYGLRFGRTMTRVGPGMDLLPDTWTWPTAAALNDDAALAILSYWTDCDYNTGGQGAQHALSFLRRFTNKGRPAPAEMWTTTCNYLTRARPCDALDHFAVFGRLASNHDIPTADLVECMTATAGLWLLPAHIAATLPTALWSPAVTLVRRKSTKLAAGLTPVAALSLCDWVTSHEDRLSTLDDWSSSTARSAASRANTLRQALTAAT